MKARLNITIDEDLLNNAKHYAKKKAVSLSELVEEYFKNLTRRTKKRNILELVDELPKPKIEVPIDVREAYYQAQKKKHGF